MEYVSRTTRANVWSKVKKDREETRIARTTIPSLLYAKQNMWAQTPQQQEQQKDELHNSRPVQSISAT